jgi:hypothetical protein
MKKFITKTSFFSIPLIIVFISWVFLISNSNFDNYGFLNFQINKLKENNGKHFDIVYIGDSSGGYSINTNLDKKNSISLCLTGSFGYYGLISYVDVIDQYVTYDELVIINSIGVASRKPNKVAYWTPYLHSFNLLNKIKASFYTLPSFDDVLLDFLRNGFYSLADIDEKFINNYDYPVTFDKTKRSSNILTQDFNNGQLDILKKLQNKLEKKKIRYHLIFSTSLTYNQDYFKNLKNEIIKRDINHLLNDPFLIDETTKGDAEEHINPKFNYLTTKMYIDLINKKKNE